MYFVEVITASQRTLYAEQRLSCSTHAEGGHYAGANLVHEAPG